MTYVKHAISEDDENPLLIMPGYDKAILGIVHGMGINERVLYDELKVIEILMERDGMDEEEANEFYEFNILDAYVGPGTPLFLRPAYELEGYDGGQEDCGRGETPTETKPHREGDPPGSEETRTAG